MGRETRQFYLHYFERFLIFYLNDVYISTESPVGTTKLGHFRQFEMGTILEQIQSKSLECLDGSNFVFIFIYIVFLTDFLLLKLINNQ